MDVLDIFRSFEDKSSESVLKKEGSFQVNTVAACLNCENRLNVVFISQLHLTVRKKQTAAIGMIIKPLQNKCKLKYTK